MRIEDVEAGDLTVENEWDADGKLTIDMLSVRHAAFGSFTREQVTALRDHLTELLETKEREQ